MQVAIRQQALYLIEITEIKTYQMLKILISVGLKCFKM